MTQLLKDFLAKKKIEYRSVTKALVEQRNDLVEEMDGILKKAKAENRALEDAESTRFDEIRSEIAKIDKTLKAEEDFGGFEKREIKKTETEEEKRALAIQKEERDFVGFVRGLAESRANLTAGAQGVVIPLTIANRIIDTVKNMSPILSKATIWNVSGDLVIPSYDYTQHVPAGYYTEFATMAAQAASFGSIKLSNLIVTSLALISKSLINRADNSIDVVAFIVNEVAKAMALFLEKELLNNANSSAGSGATKLGGLANATQVLNGATTLVIDSAELVKMQLMVPQVYQANSAWIMHPQTLANIQSLKSTTGAFLMGNTLADGGAYTILGKPVYVSDQMPQIGVGANEIFYGDLSGLHVKITQGLQMQVLQERFIDTYSVGVVAYVECDSAIIEPQKIVKYVGK